MNKLNKKIKKNGGMSYIELIVVLITEIFRPKLILKI